MSARARHRVFVVLALVFAVASTWHLGCALGLAGGGGSVARHAAFVAINLVSAVLLVARPRAALPWFAILTAQQLVSHGGDFVSQWRNCGRVDWTSLGVVVLMPLVVALLVIDAKKKRSA